MDECCICLSSDGDFMALPGCGHRVHVGCGLQLAQASTVLRCPMCRNEPLPGRGVVQGGEEDTESAIRHELVALFRLQRARAERRRRYIHSRPHLLDKWRQLKGVQRDINTHVTEAQRMYQKKCRELYRDDPEIREMRQHLTKLRRRERRLVRSIQAEVGEELV